MAHLINYKWRFYNGGYVVINFKKEDGRHGNIFLHHCVVGYPLHGLQTDHIDNNVLNNQKNNLRHVTRRENMSNQKRKKQGKTSSKYVGVYFSRDTQKWHARIRTHNGRLSLGYFKKEEDAYNAYLKALKQILIEG